MNIIEYALEEIKDDVLPVNRKLNCYEIVALREIASELAKKAPGNIADNIILEAIGAAYDYGYWQGWKHCEVEHPVFVDGCSNSEEQNAREEPEEVREV